MATPRKQATPATDQIDVGGASATSAEIYSAIDILAAAPGVMVKQPLLRAQHPLANTDYHQVAAEQRYVEKDKTIPTKVAFVAALKRYAALL